MNNTGNTQKTKRERPLSPFMIPNHYKPQITSVLSITHRLTGIFLLLGAFAFVWLLIEVSFWNGKCHCVSTFLYSWTGQIFLLGWSLSLYYHLLNGIRHLFWDAGYGFKLETVTKSGIAVIVGTILLTGLTWWAAIMNINNGN